MSLGRLAMLLMFAMGLVLAPASKASAADDPLVVADCSYGDVYQFAPAGCTASIENVGPKELTLTITPVQPGISVEPGKLVLPPQARANLSLHVLTDNIAGTVTWTYRIDGAGDKPHFVRASGFVSSVLDVGHQEINFGTAEAATLPVMRTIALTSTLDAKARATKILSTPPMLNGLIGVDGKSLTVELGTDAPWGSFDDRIELAIDSAQQQRIWVQVSGSVVGDIGPTKNPKWLGEIVWEPKRTLTVPLFDREGRDFSIGTVTSKDFAGTYDSAPCEPARAGCRNLLIHVADAQPAGLFKSHLDVTLPDRKKHLLIGIWGVLGDRPKPGEAAQPPEVTKIPVPSTPGDDGVSAIPPTMVQPDPPGSGPLLKWSISQQQSVHGFQVFRGSSADGPFALMEPHLIPKLDNGRGAAAYRWRDTSAVKGQTYWYYIAVLYNSGDRQPLSGPQKTLAK